LGPPRTPQPGSGEDGILDPPGQSDPSGGGEPAPDPPADSPDAGGADGYRRKLDGLSLAAITAVALAVAIFATLVIVEVFGTSEDDAVDVSDVLETEGAQPEGSFSKGSTAPNPDFELLGGGSSSVSEFLGKPLVINFWASTCAPCLAEMPDFESVNQELGGAVGFLGVDVVDTEEAGLEMVEQTGITYPSARDPRGEIFNAFGGTALPRTVILDAEGTVVEAVTGEMDAEELTEALEAAGLLP
jgi:cytochrome c biogenesis protein CcmG/thiol:disulfide interchange protein DsbE